METLSLRRFAALGILVATLSAGCTDVSFSAGTPPAGSCPARQALVCAVDRPVLGARLSATDENCRCVPEALLY